MGGILGVGGGAVSRLMVVVSGAARLCEGVGRRPAAGTTHVRVTGHHRALDGSTRPLVGWPPQRTANATAMPANSAAPTQLLCRKALKHGSRSRLRAIQNS